MPENATDGLCPSVHEYTLSQELINNVPYMAMTILGTAIFVAGLGSSAWGLAAAVAYLSYGAIGAFWIMYAPTADTGAPDHVHAAMGASLRDYLPKALLSALMRNSRSTYL